MLSTLKQLKHQHFLKQKAKRRAARIEKFRTSGVTIGDGTYVHPSSEILPGAQIGSGCWVNRDIFIDRAAQIGDRVYLGPRCAPQATKWVPPVSVQARILRPPS